VAYALEQNLADPRSVNCCGRAYVGLWASRVDGSEHRELLGDAGPPRAGVVVAGWTPDSRQVLFSRSTTFSASQAADGLSWQMTPLNPDDPANPQSVTTHYQVPNYDDYTHSSSDGRLLVGINGGGREATLNKSLFVLDTGSPNLGRLLTGNGVAASSPALSPDGSTIAYVQQPEGAFQDSTGERRIWLIEPDGTNPRRLTQNAVAEERPQWSADGRFILYVRIDSSAWPATTMESNPGGRVSLWRHELATGREEMLLDGIEFYTNAVNTNIGYFGHYDWDSIFDWRQ
jgi:Tol biopolymer transport system component